MFCPQCGLNSPESAKFCTSCGSSLSANAAESTEDLARKVHDHVSDTIRKTTAVTSGAVRGVTSTMPLWLKVTLGVFLVIFLLALLSHA